MRNTVYGSMRRNVARRQRHKGNPKPHKGFGFPQRLKERERGKTSADEPTKQTKREREREREDNNNISDMGQVLKDTKPNNMPSPEKNTVQKNQQRSLKYPTKTQMQIPANSQRTSHGRVAGPMGRPAISGETPRVTVPGGAREEGAGPNPPPH